MKNMDTVNILSLLARNPLAIIQILGRRRLLDWMPDDMYIKLTYRANMHKKLDLQHPKTFNEKLQYLKCYNHDDTQTQLVDKLAAKDIIGNIIGKEYIIPTIGKWKNADDISEELLPNSFVLKCNHDQGSVIIVKEKSKLNWKKAKAFLNSQLSMNWYYGTREYPYKNIKPMVFAEEMLEEDIVDYKFYCFHGEPKFLYCGKGLTINHSLKIDFYDLDWKLMPFYRTDYHRLGKIPRPKHLDEMIEIAKKLSINVPFVRIDLFEVKDKVFFSEYTLCPASGFMPFVPEQYDTIVGNWLNIESIIRKER